MTSRFLFSNLIWKLSSAREKGCLLDCLDWVPNRGACINACFAQCTGHSCRRAKQFGEHDESSRMFKPKYFQMY